MERRGFLASLGALALGSAAGCVARSQPSQSETPTPDESQTDPDPSGDDGDVQPTVTDHSIETTSTDCLSDEEPGISVSYAASGVELTGLAKTPTPCYTAAIESAAIEAGELRVRIALQRDDSMACVECVGALEYSASVSVDAPEGIDAVTVHHGDETRFTEQRGTDRPEPSPTAGPGTTPMEDPESVPDPDLAVMVVNEHDQAHEVAIEIERESGAVVYEDRHRIQPEKRQRVYNLEAASPEGIERFTISAEMDGTRESITVETNACYGNAIVSVTEDGTLYPYYSIC